MSYNGSHFNYSYGQSSFNQSYTYNNNNNTSNGGGYVSINYAGDYPNLVRSSINFGPTAIPVSQWKEENSKK